MRSPVLLIALAALAVAAHAASDPLLVHTDKGFLHGAPAADGKVAAFKGVPFAAPPIEDLRWKAPQPVAKWKGVRSAVDFGNHCIQAASYPDMVFRDPGPSEDCLNLNVWTPVSALAAKHDAKHPGLPVMVWIYGGGFTTGGSSESRQDGQFLARRDVVVVSMNYRLGIFGFMALPGLSAESGHGASGNYGLMDQAAAIDWVRRNIALFGGDPANITLFGESAGSFSVSAQMASPMAKGMLAKAIGESGAAFYSAGLGFPSRDAAETADAAWAQRIFGSNAPFYLRSVEAADLTKAAKAPGAPRFGPDIDGFFLPDSVPNLFASGQQAHIPLMGGWNSDEQHPRGAALTPAALTSTATADFAADAPAFLAVYPVDSDRQAADSAIAYASDKFIAFSTWRWLEAHVASGHAPVYRYHFELGSPGDRNHRPADGAFHSDDIEYVFGTLDGRPSMAIRPEDRALSEQMGQYWTNFARTGNPNLAALPEPGRKVASAGAVTPLPLWPVYSPTDWQVLRLNATPAASPDILRSRYLFLDSIWGKPAQ